MLIIGGLVVIGVLALIGAILLALGEGRGARAASQAPTHTVPATPEASASVTASQVAAQQPEVGVSTPESRDARPERSEPVLDAQAPAYSSGQFHELVSQLQKLHEQSKDLQARLGQLNEMVEQMQQREADMVELPRARRVS